MPNKIINELFKQELAPQNINPKNIISIEIVLSKPQIEATENLFFDAVEFEQFEDFFHTVLNILKMNGVVMPEEPTKLEDRKGYVTYYQYAFPPETEQSVNSAILLYVRVSNHSPATYRKEKRNITSLDRAKGLRKERWEPISITINEKHVENYPHAIKQVRGIIVNRLSQIASITENEDIK